MTASITTRSNSNLWEQFCSWVTSTNNRLYVGWFGGGYISAFSEVTIDRINFANDSLSLLVRGPLSTGREGHAATGNSNYGWFNGGNPSTLSTVDRLNFSNDSTTTLVRGILSATRYYFPAATSNRTR